MIDLGFILLPFEAINIIFITTAILLAAMYIGFDIIAAIAGMISVAYGFRVIKYDYEIMISNYIIGQYEAALLIIVGLFLIYRGYNSATSDRGVNTWK